MSEHVCLFVCLSFLLSVSIAILLYKIIMFRAGLSNVQCARALEAEDSPTTLDRGHSSRHVDIFRANG